MHHNKAHKFQRLILKVMTLFKLLQCRSLFGIKYDAKNYSYNWYGTVRLWLNLGGNNKCKQLGDRFRLSPETGTGLSITGSHISFLMCWSGQFRCLCNHHINIC